jgi:hypothetical protein
MNKIVTENILDMYATNDPENGIAARQDCEKSLRGIAVDLAKLHLMLKNEINKKAVKDEKCPTSYEQLANRLEIFFFIFFFLANVMVTVIFLIVGYGKMAKM